MRTWIRALPTLLLLGNGLCAEAITAENVGCFQRTFPSVGSVATRLASSVPLALVDGIWSDPASLVLSKQISDHALAGQMVDGDIPVYTWNTWGFGSFGGFNAENTESKAQYQTGRLKEQIGILRQIFTNSPEAIVCLQEVNEAQAGARTDILGALSALKVEAEFLKNTGTQAFGQMILYRKDRYFMGDKSDFKSTADSQQTNRAHKVFFAELAGKQRNLAVVNVHLAFNAPNISGLLDELVSYSQGLKLPKPLAVIAGDFNYTVGKYSPADPKVTVTQVGSSVVWSNGAPSTKQTEDNVDGFIIVQP